MPVQRGSLSIAVQDFIDRLQVAKRARRAISEGMDDERRATAQVSDIVSEQLRLDGYFKQIFGGRVDEWLESGTIGAWLITAFSAIAMIGGVVGAVLGAAGEFWATFVRRDLRPARPDPNTAWLLAFRNPQLESEMKEFMAEAGWPDEIISATREASRPRPTAFEHIASWRRGDISEELKNGLLRDLGYSQPDIDILTNLTEQIPGVQDLIRMAVREAFNEDVAARFGLDVNFPQDVVPFAEQQGLTKFWVGKFWRAHWQLPSFTQGAEMFQRLRQGRTAKVFTRDDLRVLMRANDIPDYFVDRLIEIAYNPPTRIDIRRMQQKGKIDFVEAAAMLQDTGYSPEMAKRLAELGIDEDDPLELQVSRDALLRGFKRGYLKREETIQLMLSVGMTKRSVEFWINLAEFDLAIQERDEEVEQLKILFIEGQITDVETLTALNSLGIVGDEQKTYMLQWQRSRKAKIGLPTRGDLEDWYKKGITDPTGFREGMKERNYRDRDIERYLRSMDEEVSERERKELERAQKEQERLETASQRNQYQIRLAQLDVRIAETKLAIANTKIALSNTEDPSEAEELSARLESLQIDIIEYQRDKAKVKLSKEQSEA